MVDSFITTKMEETNMYSVQALNKTDLSNLLKTTAYQNICYCSTTCVQY